MALCNASRNGVLCCAYAVDDLEVKLWLPGDPIPEEFIEAARNPDWLVSAHNDQFERLIEQHLLEPRYGWPTTPIERHRCTMATASSLALPASLKAVAAALDLEQQKDNAGHRNMLDMSKPRKPKKGEDPKGVYWYSDPARFEQLYAYCKQDVETERALHRRIGFLPPKEQGVWKLDAAINDRGIYIDGDLAGAAIRIANATCEELNLKLQALTSAQVVGEP